MIISVMCKTKAAVKITPERNSDLNEVRTHDLHDIGAVS